MTEFPYGPPRDAYLNVKEAAKEPWRGITAWIQGDPWLIIDKTDDVYVLENEKGEKFTTNTFERWGSATNHSALVAASRLEESPFAPNDKIGNLIFFEKEWNIRIADSDVALPIEDLVERYDKIRWSKTADLYPAMELRCPECGNNNPHDIQHPDNRSDWLQCLNCGHVGDSEEFENEEPDRDDMDQDFYPDWTGAKVADFEDEHLAPQQSEGGNRFEYQLPPAGIHMRTHGEMARAGLKARVHFPPGLSGMFGPIPEVLDVPSNDQQQVMATMMLDNPEQYTVHVETPHDPEAVRQLFDQVGGRRGSKVAEVGDQQNEPTIDTREALKCPRCGSHTLRAYSPDGNTATIVCLTCGNEFDRRVHINPEASVKEAINPIDPNLSAQVVGLMQQIEEAYQRGDQQTAQKLHQQMMQLMNNPNQPLMTSSDKTAVGIPIQQGPVYPPDPARQAQLAALMQQIAAAAKGGDINTLRALQQQFEQLLGGNPAYAKVDNDSLTSTPEEFNLDSMTFIADYGGFEDPYGGQTENLDDYTQQGLDPTMNNDNDIDYVHCPSCDGPGVLLGQLGKRIHYRCRNCGMDFNEKIDTDNPNQTGPDRDEPYGYDIGEDPGSTEYQQRYPLSSVEEVKEVNENTLKEFKDSSGNPLEAGKFYRLHHPSYKVPDLIKVLNLEEGHIEASIASDEHGEFPINITPGDAYSFDLYEPHHKSASGWNVVARKNFSAQEQKELIEENPRGRARNFDKLNLDGTHYQIKEESTDPYFLLGL